MSRFALGESLRRHGLQVLFAFSFAWVALFFVGSTVSALPIGQEAIESYTKAGCATALLITWLISYLRPRFLGLPPSVSLFSITCNMAKSIPISAVAIGLFAGLTSWYFDYEPESTNPQNDMVIPYAIFWYVVIFTPMLTIVLAWYFSRRPPE